MADESRHSEREDDARAAAAQKALRQVVSPYEPDGSMKAWGQAWWPLSDLQIHNHQVSAQTEAEVEAFLRSYGIDDGVIEM